jgi:hypothetical protein
MTYTVGNCSLFDGMSLVFVEGSLLSSEYFWPLMLGPSQPYIRSVRRQLVKAIQ